ncbi:MAG: histidine--tRNA ligase [Fibrobacter sp.]|nr:histidine--tRNA ligase [Fibrobacter sp.]
MSELRAPRGTKDLLPPESQIWASIEGMLREIYKIYNYKEIRTPIFEDTALFIRGVGDTTDIVEKEMYTFNDKGGRSITLRPEGTASVVRSYIEHKLYGASQPLKFFYIGPMFRYERPQAGRYRQHHQTGIEVLGGDSPLIDAEVISLGLEILKNFKLTNWRLHLNSVGFPECRPAYTEKLITYLSDKSGLCEDCQKRYRRNPLRTLDCKSATCKEIIKDAPLLTNSLCIECHDHFQKLQEYLKIYGISYELDPFLVRGLDYYTRTAFEIKTKSSGSQNQIFGGGRYNGLAEQLGGPKSPGIGFGLGLERLFLALQEENSLEIPLAPLDVFVVTIGGDEVVAKGWEILYKLREANISADMDLLLRAPKGQMKAAGRNQAKYTVIIGEDELRANKLLLRDMDSGEEYTLDNNEIVKFVEELERGQEQ